MATYDFKNRAGNLSDNDIYSATLVNMYGNLRPHFQKRITKMKEAWDFYEGYHWEQVEEDVGAPEVTENYVRAFVNKFVSFELGKGFSTRYSDKLKDLELNSDKETIDEYMAKVWDDNHTDIFSIELGQSKSITGDGWVQVKFLQKGSFEDPFDEFPNGKIGVYVVPTIITFPIYDNHDKNKLVSMTIMYPITTNVSKFFGLVSNESKVMYKQVWTKDRVQVFEGDDKIEDVVNDYGFIPFVQIKNFPIAGKTEGLSDIDDLLPMNVELNSKTSAISEIIDYHASPVTIIYGAKDSNLEKGANKVWAGLPVNARVENLELNSDLGASVAYKDSIKKSMHEIGGVPEGALGGNQSISNTSGIALQYANMPLFDRTGVKKMCTKVGLELVNKYILLISKQRGLITQPANISNYDFFYSEVTILDTLPKDTLLLLQQIQMKLTMKLTTVRKALQELGEENIDSLITEIEEDIKEHPALYGTPKENPQLNSGFTNGDTPNEQYNVSTKGANVQENTTNI